MDLLERFCRAFDIESHDKTEQATALLWFHTKSTGRPEGSVLDITELFQAANLPKPNPTRLRESFRAARDVHKGSVDGQYRLARSLADRLEESHGHLFRALPDPKVTDRAGVRQAPLLGEQDIEAAQKMAELYVILHCYENSVRRMIEKVLSTKLGAAWWDLASNSGMQAKYRDRKQKEERQKWITPRGGSPLYYIDWGDLVALIRKHEAEFLPFVSDLKFVELRLEELERLRNIVAHHGVLPADDDFQRVILSFRDWCRQVNP
jgi:hypothetical protein